MNNDQIIGTILLTFFWLIVCICFTPIREIIYSREYQNIPEDDNV